MILDSINMHGATVKKLRAECYIRKTLSKS